MVTVEEGEEEEGLEVLEGVAEILVVVEVGISVTAVVIVVTAVAGVEGLLFKPQETGNVQIQSECAPHTVFMMMHT